MKKANYRQCLEKSSYSYKKLQSKAQAKLHAQRKLKTAMLLNLKGEYNLGRVVTCIIPRCSNTPELNLSIWEVYASMEEVQVSVGVNPN